MIYNFIAEKTNANLNFNINLKKDKKVYCFIGENGSGKTQLLETMARSFLYCHSLLKVGGKYYNDLYLKDGVVDKLKEYKLYLPLGININGNEVKNKENLKLGVISFENALKYNKNIEFNNPIVFIGARNRGYAKNLDINNVKILGSGITRFLSAFTKTYNYANSIETDEISVVDWFVSRLIINPNFIKNQNTNTINEVMLICELLQELEPDKLKDLVTPNTINMGYLDGKLYFKDIPFEKLSTGYVSIIKIFQDIIDGFSSWTGTENKDIKNVEGVVFIDEIEAHLHPKWEQSIIPLLKRHFPKATFYIATHSPLIIATTEEGEAYELTMCDKNIESKELGNPKAWYMADVYSQGFHVDYNKEFEKEQENIIKLIAEYSKLVKEYTKNKNLETKARVEGIYQNLNKIMAETDPRRKTIDNLKLLVM